MKNRTRMTGTRLINADEMEFIHYTGVGRISIRLAAMASIAVRPHGCGEHNTVLLQTHFALKETLNFI